MTIDDMEQDLLAAYRALHDGLSDMIDEGHLKEADIPDDYRWLVDMLVELCDLNARLDDALEAEGK